MPPTARFPRLSLLLVAPLFSAACASDSSGVPVSTDPAATATPSPTTNAKVKFKDEYLAAPAALAPNLARPDGLTVVSVDPKRGVPRFAWGHRRPLPASALARSPKQAALYHLGQHAAALGLELDALGTVEIAHVHDTGRGAIVVKLRQVVNGVPVWRDGMRIVMDRDFRLVAITGSLHAEAVASRTPASFRLDAAAAIDRAIGDVLGSKRVSARPAAAGAHAGYQRFTDADLAQPARAKPVLFPLPDRLVPAYLSEVVVKDGSTISPVRHVIAADDGRVLYRTGFGHDAAHTYRVWGDTDGAYQPADGPQADYTPHPTGTPDGFDPEFIAPVEITIDSLNEPGDPWLPEGATETVGNNVDAYADIGGDDGYDAGDLRPTVTAPGQFLRTFDTSADPAVSNDQIMASVTQLFYVNNWLHDYWYDSGFDEAGGNAQADNFGRGGIDGDVLLAEGQDWSGTDNANMQTPLDGDSPRMQMYVFSPPTAQDPEATVRRDGTIDGMVIAHEWGHYWHLRQIECGSSVCYGMSEGFGDFSALFMTLREGDDTSGAYAMSAYLPGIITANPAYFGIRRYPYSNDFDKSPLTFRHVADDEPLPDGPPRETYWDFVNNFEVHMQGEIWAAALWEALTALTNEAQGPESRYSFDEAKRRFADYLVAGMQASPVEPSHTEVRDAILAAAQVSDEADFMLIAEAFARRGFGTGASLPVTSETGNEVVESFGLGGVLGFAALTLAEDTPSCDNDGVLDTDETGTLTIEMINTGIASLTDSTATVSSATPGVTFPNGATVTFTGTVEPLGSATAEVTVALGEGTPESIVLDIELEDDEAATDVVTSSLTVRVNVDVTPNASATEDVEAPTPPWILEGGSQIAEATGGGSTVFFTPNPATVSDNTITTPPLEVSATDPLTITFSNRYSFECCGYDGAVMEVSTDDGATWQDISAYADPGYNGVVETGFDNPLSGREAWIDSSASFPAFEDRTLNLGTTLAGETIRVRFRFGSDSIGGGEGWEIDDIAFTGITNTPFTLTAPEDGACGEGEPPVADAGDDQEVEPGDEVQLDGTGSSDPEGGALTYTWAQVAGPTVELDDGDTATPSFVAPEVDEDTVVSFSLTVEDPDGQSSAADTVDIVVAAEGGNPPIDDEDGGCGCSSGGSSPAGGALLFAGALAMALRRRRKA